MELWIFNHSRPFNQFQIHISGPIDGAIHRNGTRGHFASTQRVLLNKRKEQERVLHAGWFVFVEPQSYSPHRVASHRIYVGECILFRHSNFVHLFLSLFFFCSHVNERAYARAYVDLFSTSTGFVHSFSHFIRSLYLYLLPTVRRPDIQYRMCVHRFLMSAVLYEGCMER